MLFVIKFGSTSLTNEAGGFHNQRIRTWISSIAKLIELKHQVIIVSSGAIVSRASHIKIPGSSLTTIQKQALASVGQPYLMDSYRKLFNEKNLHLSQILLTDDDLANNERSLNIVNTLQAVLNFNAVPIINENDSTSFTEIQFGDNDMLSALVARLMSADHLIIASDVDGFYPADPKTDPNLTPISVIRRIDDKLLSAALPAKSWKGRGGMLSKLQAAKLAADSGVETYITHGDNADILPLILQGKHRGTHILAQKNGPSLNPMDKLFQSLRESSRQLLDLPIAKKNRILKDLAKALKQKEQQKNILRINQQEIRAQSEKLSKALLDRLSLDPQRLALLSQQVNSIAALADPLAAKQTEAWHHPLGFKIKKCRVPLGVVAMIFESRPNVLIEAFALCLKSGNSVLLRPGSESFETCKALLKLVHAVLKKHRVSCNVIQMPPSSERKYVLPILQAKKYIDLVVPRGGESLISFVEQNSRIPVVKHDKGLCHLFVDKSADDKMALQILINGKTQRPGVCNALETLLIHKDRVKKFLPKAIEALQKAGVECRLDSSLMKQFKKQFPGIRQATAEDWDTEYLDLIISVQTVGSLDEAIHFISQHGSNHSDAIVTKSKRNASEFLKKVDSAAVYHNVSTRFTDGFELGLGAEMGISTQKLHVRGPMGLQALTTYKYVVEGKGQIRN